MVKRIGFACKWIDREDQCDGIKATDDCKKYNTATTTVAWLKRQSRDVAEQKLWDLMKYNIESSRLLVERVGKLDTNLRMVRLSSDILPVFTEPNFSYFYRKPDVIRYAETHFAKVGDLARNTGTRLSMHPGQFCVLASDIPDVVNRSIEEFEYHATMAAWMGFGRSFQDFKINVHVAGRAGTKGIRDAYQRLSKEARNCITIENEEISYGLNDCLDLSDILPIVLDIHHHWIREGEYIEPNDPRVARVIESWRGRRPTVHYSVSREELLYNHSRKQRPSLSALLESGHKKQKLRAHSNFYWNSEVNQWALSHWEWGDIMAESKAKNLASFALYEEAKNLGLN